MLETELYTIVGDVTLPAEGFHSRLSGLLNREGVQFIPLVDATISSRDGEHSVKRPFIAAASADATPSSSATGTQLVKPDRPVAVIPCAASARRRAAPRLAYVRAAVARTRAVSASDHRSPSPKGSSGCMSSTIQASCSSSPSSCPADQPA